MKSFCHFSRDFLRAVQVCQLPQFEKDDCQKPKVVPLSINYEVFPDCRQTTNWCHPDMILVCCIQHIGNPRDRIEPKREYHGSQGHKRNWMLSNFSDGDMDVVVRCVHQLDNFHNPTSVNRRVMRPFERMGGPKPIYFLNNEIYRKEWWRFVNEMVVKDEAKYGLLYAEVLAKRKQQGAS